jgi:hypothetical protein
MTTTMRGYRLRGTFVSPTGPAGAPRTCAVRKTKYLRTLCLTALVGLGRLPAGYAYTEGGGAEGVDCPLCLRSLAAPGRGGE